MSYPDIENAEDYAEYESAVESGSEGLKHFSSGACVGCKDCEDYCERRDDYKSDDEWSEAASEPHFSWNPCHLCSRSLGGDREPAHAFTKDKEIVHFQICTDCVYYIEYGRLDDMTMEQIGD